MRIGMTILPLPQEEVIAKLQRMRDTKNVPVVKKPIFFEAVNEEGKLLGLFTPATVLHSAGG